MATDWKSQQSDGKYSLQFETDNKEKYKLVEKAAQMAVDGKTPCDNAYIGKEKVLSRIRKLCEVRSAPPMSRDDIVELKLLQKLEKEFSEIPTADVVEVKHGEWHIMSEDPYDESDSPTEEGWYRIITTDGEEMTDYFFAKPTMTGYGCVYWKNCKKVIRAWAKIDGKEETEDA